MSNEEEKRCPLCAEEMDWTDQQFMPCKCGYQVCVWCWHHIMDMSEKDQAEGRCPACRTIYEKEKIVAMQANCEKTMTLVSSKKAKPPKAKPKANEVKKDLTNVRVIQRKMAYVIGLPLSLADEKVLQRKEYFGQYGKVTKVALSRTTGGTIQQFTNDTCSVYITFSKEEEALRCIQFVHGFVLEGRFLRASFGTAKYCHAWLKNMPCNNSACLYLHTIGADEDSFGKEEVAAVHTRNRVQQIVGANNTVVTRSGNMLPPPVDDVCNSSSIFIDKPTIRSGIYDATNCFANGTDDTTFPPNSKDSEGANAVAQKITSFVDIVGRSNSAALEKDTNTSENRMLSNLCSDLSSVTINGDTQPGEPYSFPTRFKMSSSNHIGNGLFENIPDDQSFLSNDQGSNWSHDRTLLGNQYHPATISEDSRGPALLHKKNHCPNGFTGDHDPVPIRCVNAVLTDSCQEMKFQNSIKSDRIYDGSCQEMKFQNSAKSDRIYRSSNSFSNEEIVEHLRRIDDGETNNDKKNSVLDSVESSIISNIMSMGLDSCEDSMAVTQGLPEFLDETDGLGGSSWSSLNSDQSGCSFVKQDGFANQMAGPILPEYGDNMEQYLCKPQYPVSRSQGMAPPGFTVPSRDPPPGFSTSGRTGSLSRASSGTGLGNGSLFASFFVQPSSTGHNGIPDDTDFFNPPLLNCNRGMQANGFKSPSYETSSISNSQLNAYNDESRPWLFRQQSASAHQDSKFSQLFPSSNPSAQHGLSYKAHMGNGLSAQQEPSYKAHMGNGLSGQQEPGYMSHMGNGLSGQQEPGYMSHMGNGLSGQQEPSYMPHMGNGLSAQQEPSWANGLSTQREPSYLPHMGNRLPAQQKPSYTAHMGNGPFAQLEPSYNPHIGNGLSGLDDMYGLSSRLKNEHQNYNQSFFTQTYGNGHMSSINGGYRHSVEEVQHNKGEVGMNERQRNERLGGSYFSGHGDLMCNSNDVYTRAFGL